MSITNQQMALLISSASFFMFFLVCIGVVQYFRKSSKKRDLIEKIQGAGYTGSTASYVEKTPQTAASAIAKPFINFLSLLGRRVKQDESLSYSGSRIKFVRAGIYSPHAGSAFWGAKLFLGFCLPVIFIVFRFTAFKVFDNPMALAIAVMAALLGFYLPDIWLKIKANRRKEVLRKALPDALDLLVICVEAGMGMDAAFNRVATEIKFSASLLSDEINLTNLELRAGRSRQDSLRNLALRTGLEEVNSLVSLLIQADKFGTNVATAIRVYADSFRTQRFQKAEEIAAKIPVKLVLPLILFIFPSLFVVLLGPAAIKIYQNMFQHF